MLARRLLIASHGGGTLPAPTPPPEDGIVTDLTTNPNGGWSAPTNPKALYAAGKTYVGFVNGTTGGIRIGAWDHSAETFSHVLLDTPTPPDDHNNPAILVRASDGRVLVAFCRHGGPAMYTMLSTNPGDISAFGAAVSVGAGGGGQFTYPTLFQLTGVSGDPIYLLWRDNTSGSSASQTGRLMLKKSTDDGATWSAAEMVFSGASTLMPYWTITADATSIHVLTTDRDAYGQDGGTLTVGHFYLDGTDDTWHQSDGTEIVVSKPYGIGDLTEVYDGSEGVAFPNDGYLVAGVPSFALLVDTGSSMVSGRLVRWNGSAWTSVEVYEAPHPGIDRFYGGLVFNRSDPDEAFAGIEDGSATELVRFRSANGGVTWDAGVPMTSSSVLDNVSPWAVVDGDPTLPVVWLYGYLPSGTTFDFLVRGLVRP